MSLTNALRAMLPPGTALGQADPFAPATGLWPEEQAAMTRAIPARMREFAAGRRAARAAMAALGLPPASIPHGPDRAPVWPEDLTGTISHSGGACLALVGQSPGIGALGLDLEPALPLPGDLLDSVCLPSERALTRATPLAARMIFCAKEASYKAQYRLSGQILDFHDLEVTGDPAAGRFIARLLRACPPFAQGTQWAGRIVTEDGLIAALVILPDPRSGAINTVFRKDAK